MTNNIEKIDQGLVAFEALKTKAEELGSRCNDIQVEDEAQLNIAMQILGEANDVLKFIEQKRKELKAPVLDIGKQIDAKAKELTSLLEPNIENGKKIVKKFHDQKEFERQEELRKLAQLQEEQIKKEQERINKIKEYLYNMQADITKKTLECDTIEQCDRLYNSVNEKYPDSVLFHECAELSIQLKYQSLENINERKSYLQLRDNTSDESQADLVFIENAINKKIVNNVNAIVEDVSNTAPTPTEEIKEMLSKETELQAAKLKNTRMIWKWEIADWTQVPDAWKQINSDIVSEYLSTNKSELESNCIINGIRFYQDSIVVLK